MQRPDRAPADAFVFICTNRRPASNPLGPGCGEHGEALHQALQQGVARGRLWSRLWLVRSACLGLCPRDGAAVALTPSGELRTGATAADAPTLLDLALGPRS